MSTAGRLVDKEESRHASDLCGCSVYHPISITPRQGIVLRTKHHRARSWM